MNLIDSWKHHWSQAWQRWRGRTETDTRTGDMEVHVRADTYDAHETGRATSVTLRRLYRSLQWSMTEKRRAFAFANKSKGKKMKLSTKLSWGPLWRLSTSWNIWTLDGSLTQRSIVPCKPCSNAEIHLVTITVIVGVWWCWLKPCLPPSRFLSGFDCPKPHLISRDLCLEY